MQQVEKLIASPFNYTGGKFRLLPQIFPFFPSEIDVFVDLFAGGGCVGINVNAKRIILNDIENRILKIMKLWKNNSEDMILNKTENIIQQFKFSDTAKNGYEKYGCCSQEGLSRFNRIPFENLKCSFNGRKFHSDNYYYELYVAIIFSFNNQIRFNSKGQFNLPVGKRDFNDRMKKKLSAFIKRLHHIDVSFSCLDFKRFDFKCLTEKDFVYADPPYLITCASYNENGGWSKEYECALLSRLDNLNSNGIRFALSNVLETKGNSNQILLDWLIRNPNYRCHHLKQNYSNSNYHRQNKGTFSDEVLITNY